MASNDTCQVSFKTLHPTIGAECHGIDFSRPLPEDEIQIIRDGMAKYGVLVFRGAQLDDARHVAFARQLGELDSSTVFVAPGKKYRLDPFVELTDVSNIEDDGSILQKDSLKYQLGQGNNLFHVDCSYNNRRVGLSILRAHQLPPKGTGGGTAFADTRTAYDDLDAETKDKIKDYVLWHSIWHSRRLAAPDCDFLKYMPAEKNSMARHKLVQLHEASGRMNLYIAAHGHHFDGWTKEDSQPVIQALLDHATQDKYTFTIEWENDGDIVIWDNTCVMHKAAGGSFAGKYVRDMRRATLLDSSSTAWGLNPQKEESKEDLMSDFVKGYISAKKAAAIAAATAAATQNVVPEKKEAIAA
ncbi:alpha-ketoglutarate-dependent 2-4-dichlorophenoxyacetate dioxygenase [Penicillium pulvis]|uniref:alpha-ketoglutarate-dependent 2-4-dichlorophenoxyacetate dioxygenase n=1 Tax=Penicillium pulvis TaxID=1562058 RepID=UPI0025496DE8|nr:alpha-ketoglutarate-dependent 2-4-dichlorophenoxyacetate dioxygenase [Penicillium pulvis]KAJ5786705.1 alpha-ketoglutarate-dependent 2-4-dichlorophenoxyacetate dioxygenase [Penicillium pulvis]